MAPSIEAKRKELALSGVDPFLLIAQLLERNEELKEQVEVLERIVRRNT
jgi:hypothetical protein